jgi:hypothetical protein
VSHIRHPTVRMVLLAHPGAEQQIGLAVRCGPPCSAGNTFVLLDSLPWSEKMPPIAVRGATPAMWECLSGCEAAVRQQVLPSEPKRWLECCAAEADRSRPLGSGRSKCGVVKDNAAWAGSARALLTFTPSLPRAHGASDRVGGATQEDGVRAAALAHRLASMAGEHRRRAWS